MIFALLLLTILQMYNIKILLLTVHCSNPFPQKAQMMNFKNHSTVVWILWIHYPFGPDRFLSIFCSLDFQLIIASHSTLRDHLEML